MGLVQGLLFWWLNQGAEQAPFPAPWPTVLSVPVVMLPLAFTLLGAFLNRDARLTWGTLGVTALTTLAVLSHMALGTPEMALLAGAVAVVGLLLVQTASLAGTWRFPYPRLFGGLITNATLLAGGTLFSGVMGLLITLVAALFGGIGLDAVPRLLGESWVFLPLAGAAFAFSVTRLRTRPELLETPVRVLLTLLAWLLPPAAVLTGLFVLALPVAGLQSAERLFEGLLSSSTYLALTLAVLLLTNAAYQDGEDRPALPDWAQRLTSGTLLLLPLFPLLALYGLSRRVAEYGLTEARVVGLAAAAVLLVLAVGTAWTAWRTSPWLSGMGRANTAALALVGVTALGLSLPGLLPLHLTIRSQAGRLADGPSAETLDRVRFLAYESGEAGRRALRDTLDRPLPVTVTAQARDALTFDAPEFNDRYRETGAPVPPWVFSSAPLAGSALPDPQAAALVRVMRAFPAFEQYCGGGRPTCRFRYVLAASDGPDRALVFQNSSWPKGLWFEEQDGEWARRGRFRPTYPATEVRPLPPSRLAGAPVWLETLALEVVRVGEQVLFLDERESR